MQRNSQNTSNLWRRRPMILLSVLHVILAFSKIVAGIILITRSVPFRLGVGYSMAAVLYLPAGSLLLLSGVLWLASCIHFRSRILNGVNLGFAIPSFIAAGSCESFEIILITLIGRCSPESPNCQQETAKMKFCYPMLIFSSFLIISSICNIVFSSMECCCRRPTSQLQESNVISAENSLPLTNTLEIIKVST